MFGVVLPRPSSLKCQGSVPHLAILVACVGFVTFSWLDPPGKCYHLKHLEIVVKFISLQHRP